MKIKFSRKIYRKKAIKLAIEDYHQLADFNFKESKEYFEVEIKNIDRDVKDIIKDEFANYVLSLMKS